MKQHLLVEKYVDVIVKKGKQFQKTKGVHARVAKGGEVIVTTTKDKTETKNIASAGDFIVKNLTGEEYIIKPEAFHKRYVLEKDDYYVPSQKAVIWALQMTEENIRKQNLDWARMLIDQPDKPVYIEAAWKEDQAVYLNDYLACPVSKNEVYCIDQKAFNSTYEEI